MTMTGKIIALLLAGCTLCSAFTSIGTNNNKPSALSLSTESSNNSGSENNNLAVSALASALVTGSLLFQPLPAIAVQPTLAEAIVEVSETSYPVLKGLDPAAFSDFSTKIGDLLLRIPAEKLGKSLELGIDALDSAPQPKLAEFNRNLNDAYSELNTDSCSLVPLPPMSIVSKFQAVASDNVNPDKLKTFEETWKPSLEALKRTSDGNKICLPANRASLDRLALAQADLARSFGKAEMKAFGSYTTPLIKSVVTPGKALGFVSDAKLLAPNVSSQDKKAFAAAGKKVESASQLQVARDKIAEKNAKKIAAK